MEQKREPDRPVSLYLVVRDGAGAIDFYKCAFGAEIAAHLKTSDGRRTAHCTLRLNGGIVYLSDDFPEMAAGRARTPDALGETPVTIHLRVADADAVFNRAVKAGAQVIMPLGDMFWGECFGQIKDPFGHRWSISTLKKIPSEAEIKRGLAQHFRPSGMR